MLVLYKEVVILTQERKLWTEKKNTQESNGGGQGNRQRPPISHRLGETSQHQSTASRESLD